VEIRTAPVAGVLDVLDVAAVDAAELVDLLLELPQPAASSAITGATNIASDFLTAASFRFCGAPDATPPHVKDG
jgi:hypothetical protein